MLARLWWKEARTLWPLWAAVLAIAVVTAGLGYRYDRPAVISGALGPILIGVTLLYAFAVGATAFAGEREEKTLAFLDTLPVDRRALWRGKASFAFLSLLALVLTCALLALACTAMARRLGLPPSDLHPAPSPPAGGPAGEIATVLSVLMAALAWSWLWSALREGVLTVAVLAMLSVAAVELAWSALGGVAPAGLVPPAWALRLAFSGAATAASWAIMTQPPRPGRPPAAPRTLPIAATEPRAYRPGRGPWAPAFLGLIWQAAREARSAGLGLLAVGGLGAAIILFHLVTAPARAGGDGVAMALLLAATLGLSAGVVAFADASREGGPRFLLHHGVRPGSAWLARVLVWAVPVAAFAWLLDRVGLAGMWWAPRPGRPKPNLGGLLVATGFAVGQLCGLTIRRPITAGTVGVLAMILLAPPLVALQALEIVPTEGLALVPLALLAIGLAWSGDWMADRAGAGRWLRLAGLVGVAAALLFGGFVNFRARGLPDIGDPFARVEAPPAVAAGEGANEEYRRAGAAIVGLAPVRGSFVDMAPVGRVIADGWDPAARSVVAYWTANAGAIDRARLAADRPHAGFPSPSAATITAPLDPALDAMRRLVTLLALDARERQARGDLAGAWGDLRAIGRTASHAAEGGGFVPRLIARGLDARAIAIGMAWAADPRQTPALLRAALAEPFPMPPMAGTLRAEYEIHRRSLELSAEALTQAVAPSQGTPSTLRALADTWLSAPWERERARRLFNILYAHLAEVAAVDAWARPAEVGNYGVPALGFAWPPGEKRWFFPQAELELAIESTPIVQLLGPPAPPLLYSFDRGAVDRRAFTLVLALRTWQLEHGGRYPLALRELVPSLLPALPVDPFSGKAFGYIPSQGQAVPELGLGLDRADAKEFLRPTRLGQWLLYSVGPDKKDDRAEKDLRADVYRSYGDYVFPLPDAGGPSSPH